MHATRSAPTGSILDLATLKAKLGITSANYDTDLTGIIAAVTDKLDGQYGVLNSSVRQTTWVLHLDAFPANGVGIKLPYGPVRNLVEVAYDQQGATMAAVVDETFLYRDGRQSYACRHGEWPDDVKAKPTAQPVRITYQAGYDDVPAPIKRVALAMAASQFDQGSMYAEASYRRHPQFMSLVREYKL